MSLTALLSNDTITVQDPVVLRDRSGGPTQASWNTVYANVPARVEDASARQVLRYAAYSTEVSHIVFTEQAGIGKPQRIRTSDGRYLRVTGVKKHRGLGGIQTYYAVLCIETRPGT